MGKFDLAKILLEKGADIEAKDLLLLNTIYLNKLKRFN